MTDYKPGALSILQTYGASTHLMLNAMQTFIESAIENERARIKASVSAVCPDCQRARDAATRTVKTEMKMVRAALDSEARMNAPIITAPPPPPVSPLTRKKRKVTKATRAKMRQSQLARWAAKQNVTPDPAR
jgi:hypothetical protein